MSRGWIGQGPLTTVAIAILALLAWAGPAGAVTLPPGFQETTSITGLELPTVVEFAPNGRVFVAEKNGIVKTYDSVSDPTPTVFADLRTQVHSYWDRGIQGLAVDPNFPASPYVYVYYVHDAPIGGTAPTWGVAGQDFDDCPSPPSGPGGTNHGCPVSVRVSRLVANGDVMSGPEQVLVEDSCLQYPSHAGGGLEFGADGFLYATFGEGASFTFWDYGQDGDPGNDWHPINPCGDPPSGVDGAQAPPTAEGGRLRSQDLRTSGDPLGLNGSLIRIDPATGAGVPGNPMFSSPEANKRRMLAYGMRNPFRIALRPGTNDVWIGDVGGAGWEELNRVPAPTGAVRNFGWPCYEGGLDATGAPVSRKLNVTDQMDLNICENLYADTGAVTANYWAYDHATDVVPGEDCAANGSAISALAFYPMSGGTFPAAYQGALLIGDYSRECIWAMLAGPDGLPDPTMIQPLVEHAAFPVDLTVGPGGDVFYVDVSHGELRRLHYTGNPTNRPPIANAQANPITGAVPLTVAFDGTGSSDPDVGDSLTYEWDLDADGQFDDSTAVSPSFTYATAGTYAVKLRVTDGAGVFDTDTVMVYPGGGPPAPVIDSPSSGTKWSVGDTISFSGSATDPDDGALPASALDWELIMHHCTTLTACHEHPVTQFQNVASGSFIAPDHPYPSHLELRLTATDSDANTGTASLQLDPRVVGLNFDTKPPGLAISYGDTSSPAPFLMLAIQGSAATLTAPSPQTLGNTTYRFAGWRHGQAQSHVLPAPTASKTYTADFAAVTPGVQTLGYRPEADSFVDEASPGSNFGTTTPLRAGAPPGAATESHLRFLVNGLVGKIQSATLRLRSKTDTVDGPAVYKTAGGWTETGLNWLNRPSPTGGPLADTGAIAAGTTTDWDVTSAVTGEGAVNFRLSATSADPVDFESREAAVASQQPLLIVTVLNDAYARPKGATPSRFTLVPAYNQCTSPNRVHGPALESGSCAPPAQTSSELTVGTADANGTATNSVGAAGYGAIPGNASTTADEADAVFTFSLTDVRKRVGLADYTGELQAVTTLRATDKNSDPSGTDPATLTDLEVPVTIPCTPTGDTSVGSTCSVTTTFEAITPGMVREGARSIWQLGQIEVRDGGPDGDVDTPGNGVFARQGIFIP